MLLRKNLTVLIDIPIMIFISTCKPIWLVLIYRSIKAFYRPRLYSCVHTYRPPHCRWSFSLHPMQTALKFELSKYLPHEILEAALYPSVEGGFLMFVITVFFIYYYSVLLYRNYKNHLLL